MKLKRPFKDALVENAQDILRKKTRIPNKLVPHWTTFLNLLGKGDVRRTLRRELLGTVMNHSGKYANAFFNIYGEEIADKDVLIEEKMVVHKLFSPLLKARNIGGLQWLKHVFSTNPGIIDKFTDTASVQDFREHIQGEISKSSNDQSLGLITEIVNLLSIEPNKTIKTNETLSENDTPKDSSSLEENSNKE